MKVKFNIFILLLIFIFISNSKCYDAWLQKFHDSSLSSQSSCDPIINNLEWSFNFNYNINNSNNSINNTNSSNITIPTNIIILSDQSIISVNISTTDNNLVLNRYSTNYGLMWSIEIPNTSLILENSINTGEINLIANEGLSLLLVYIKKLSIYYAFDFNSGGIHWNSSENGLFYNCTDLQLVPDNYYALCENQTGSVDVYIITTSPFSIVQLPTIDPYNGTDINNTLKSDIGNRNLIGYLSSYNISMVHLDYYYNNTGLISLVSMLDHIFLNSWVPSYHSNQTQYIVDQVNGIVISSENIISFLVCVDGLNMYLDSYNVTDGSQINSQIVVINFTCNNIADTKVGLLDDQMSLVVMFTLLYNNSIRSYLGIVEEPPYFYLHWIIQGDNSHYLLDFVTVSQETIYVCTQNSLFLVNYTSKLEKYIDLPHKNDITQCSISIGENTAMVLTVDTTGATSIMRIVDSVCGEDLCPTNFTCGVGKCQCGANYYPQDICRIYCNADSTCHGNGLCDENGLCVCDDTTGYDGPSCSVCKKGYFGGNCNFHFNIVGMAVGGSIAFLATISICIFCIVTMPKSNKPSKFKKLYNRIYLFYLKLKNRSYSKISENEIPINN